MLESNVLAPDDVTARFKSYAAHWRNIVGVSDERLAEMIHADAIDVLVDLNGHTSGNRLQVFARKPAPVQFTYIGYWDTTGLAAIDHRLTDAHADPVGTTEQFYAEKLSRLPETFSCFRPADFSPDVGPLPADANGFVTFGSFHTLAKLNAPLLESWSEILRRTPGSRLTLVAAGLDEPETRSRVERVFLDHGIDASRLNWFGRQPPTRYLELHNGIDVMLDSFPFAGHTIACHALWMGVPVVTRAGMTHCSRTVTSVLKNVGLEELVTGSEDEYVRVATELAGDTSRLRSLRAGLRERMRNSPVCDAARFTRNVEEIYRQAWRGWCGRSL